MKKILLASAIFTLTLLAFNAQKKAELPYIPLNTIYDGVNLSLDSRKSASLNVNAGAKYEQSKEYISEIKKTDFLFSSIGFEWNEEADENSKISLYIRLREKEKWTDWMRIGEEQDNKEEETGNKKTAFISVNSADAFQYKVVIESNGLSQAKFSNVKIIYINATDPPDLKTEPIYLAGDYPLANRVRIISRSEWGADETIRIWNENRPKPEIKEIDVEYTEKFADELKIKKKITVNSKGESLTWPLEYPEKVSKFIIHHTASVKNLDNPAKAIRDIYLWHSLGRGWGDIGYNYIIDPKGNVYEGRYGGEGVVGAHAGKANTGSIGIAILGNYEDSDVPEAALLALSRLIAEKSAIHSINPSGTSEFRGEITSNILGHKDVMPTICPGKYIYSKLDVIRKLSNKKITTTFENAFFRIQKSKGYNYEDLSGIYYINIDPDKTKQLTIKLKNTGTVAWGNDTTLVLNNEKSFKDKLEFKSNSLTSPVSPGQTAIFTASIKSKYKEGFINLNIAPIINGKTKLEKYIEIPFNITPLIYSYEVAASNLPSGPIKVNSNIEKWIELKNTGNVPWFNSGDNPVLIGTEHPRDRLSLFTRPAGARIGFLQKERVNPGETGKFIFKLKAPAKDGEYTEYFAPVAEGIRWMEDKKMNFKVFVYSYPYNFSIYSMSTPNNFYPSEKKTIWLKIKNTGGITWTNEGENKLVIAPFYSSFKLVSAKLMEKEVKPGEVGEIQLELTAPKKTGKYGYRFKIRAGENLLTRIPISLPVRVISKTEKIEERKTKNLIKIGLSFEGNPIITANGNFALTSSGKILKNFSAGDEAEVKFENNRYSIKSKSFSSVSNMPVKFEPAKNTILEIKNYEKRPEWNKNLNDNRFRGALEIIYYNNKLKAINELDLEDYLKGLAEASNTDPYEKIKAIIIAGRTYAKYYITKAQKFPGAPYNLDDDPNVSQKYLGYGYEIRSPNTVKAVKETEGMVIIYKNELIKTPYFSSSDGRTRSYKEVWGGPDIPYLQSVPDTYCKAGVLYGHGVGLSGCGAAGMAAAGKKYDEILKYFYKGIELKKIY